VAQASRNADYQQQLQRRGRLSRRPHSFAKLAQSSGKAALAKLMSKPTSLGFHSWHDSFDDRFSRRDLRV
jgi:hypothetical protein